MKSLAQTLLVTFFTTAFVLVLFSSTLKFWVLDYNFWITSFQKHNVYTRLSLVVKNSFEEQTAKSGGNKKDIVMLTDLITPENTTDFINKNIFNLLGFMNGKFPELTVYVPIDKVPKDLLPKNIAGLDQYMTVGELGTKFNIVGLEKLPLKNMSQVGLYTHYLFMGSSVLAIILLFLIILLVEAGKRFVAPAAVFILSGLLTLTLIQFATRLNNYMNQSVSIGASLNKLIILTVLPPVIDDIAKIWTYVGIIIIAIGMLFFLIKTKPPIQKIPLKRESF